MFYSEFYFISGTNVCNHPIYLTFEYFELFTSNIQFIELNINWYKHVERTSAGNDYTDDPLTPGKSI